MSLRPTHDAAGAQRPCRPRGPLRAAALAVATLAACSTPPPLTTPPAALQPTAAAWQPRRAQAGLQPELDALPATWWTLFEDPLLADLEREAAAGNLDLQAAAVRLDESRARLGLVKSTTAPNLSAGAGVTRAGLSADSPLAALGAPTTAYNQWELGLQAAWELDFWGHQRQQTAAAAARAESSQWAVHAASASLSAEVARQYLLLRGLDAQRALALEQQRIALELQRLADSRASHGVATRFDVAAAAAEVPMVRARLLQLDQQRDALLDALALLLGREPGAVDARLREDRPVPRAQRLPVGLPSELTRRRPDVRQAEAQLRAAVAEVGAAQADFYPRVRLTASLGLAAFKLEQWDSWDARQFAVGPAIHLPLFDGGRLKQTLALTEARQREAALTWRQTVLAAWHEVTDALDRQAVEQARQQQLAEAAALQSEAFVAATAAWKAGSSDFGTVLQAQRRLLDAQGALSDSRVAQGLAVVSLYRALGGGWADDASSTVGDADGTAPAVVAGVRP